MVLYGSIHVVVEGSDDSREFRWMVDPFFENPILLTNSDASVKSMKNNVSHCSRHSCSVLRENIISIVDLDD